MVELLRSHRTDDCRFVDHLGEPWQQFADPRTGLARLLEAIWRSEQLRDALDEGEPLAFKEMLGAIRSAVLLEFGLRIEQLQLRWAAGHV